MEGGKCCEFLTELEWLILRDLVEEKVKLVCLL